MYAQLLESGRRQGRGGLSPSTVRSIHRVLSRALNDAVEQRVLESNPTSRAKPPKAKVVEAQARKARRFLDHDQVRTFLQSVQEHRMRAAFHLAATTGMRRGELLGLRWTDLDLDSGRLVVEQTLLAPRYELTFSQPKTKHGRALDRPGR
jgi:integrase